MMLPGTGCVMESDIVPVCALYSFFFAVSCFFEKGLTPASQEAGVKQNANYGVTMGKGVRFTQADTPNWFSALIRK